MPTFCMFTKLASYSFNNSVAQHGVNYILQKPPIESEIYNMVLRTFINQLGNNQDMVSHEDIELTAN